MNAPTQEQFADKKEELADLFFQCARYERKSTDWIEALDVFTSDVLQAGRESMLEELRSGGVELPEADLGNYSWKLRFTLEQVQDYGDRRAAAAVPHTQAARDVLSERQRQVSVEGWTPEHDDHHKAGDLAIAGVCYASNAATFLQHGTDALRNDYKAMSPGSRWPWDYKWWKPSNERRDLVKGATLILAEIERIDRTTPEAA